MIQPKNITSWGWFQTLCVIVSIRNVYILFKDWIAIFIYQVVSESYVMLKNWYEMICYFPILKGNQNISCLLEDKMM